RARRLPARSRPPQGVLPGARGQRLGPRVLAAACAARPTRPDALARAARGAALRLGRGNRQQRGGSARAQPAPQARRARHPHGARARLRDRRSRRRLSIRRQLLVALLAALLATGVGASGATWLAVRKAANDLFDYHLEQMALSLADQTLATPAQAAVPLGQDYVVQVWDASGVLVYI